MKFSLKQLRYALAVADSGHFGHAAKKCNVTQSALSQQIAQLEDQCQAQLFDRDAHPICPTPYGREFLDHAAIIWEHANALEAFTINKNATPDRALRLALIPTVAPYLLPQIYPALLAQLPDVKIAALERQTENIMLGLADGSIDVAIIATDLPDGQALTGVPLFADHFVLATSTTRHINSPVSLEAIPRNELLLLDEGHCFRDQAIAACALKAGELQRPFSATSLSTIVEFVANNQGVTLLPTIALAKEARDPRIEIHQLSSPGAGRLLSLVWQQNSPFAELYLKIGEIIRNVGNERFYREIAPPPAPAPVLSQS